MTQYWWVNHKQTIQHEVEGGYLWAPKTEANGTRSQFYENMREAAPGDMVVSYAYTQVNYIGVVTDYAFSASKPGEFGAVGSYWTQEGWLLPIAWWEAPIPVEPKNLLGSIIPLLPSKYSPLNPKTGHGNQKAYLAKIDNRLFEIIAREINFEEIKPPISSSSRNELVIKLEASIQQGIEKDSSLEDTEKKQIIKARIGQGEFRRSLFKIEQKCRVTGIKNASLLVASHIKPWRSCISSHERLDGFNGLLLTPHIDHLFDRGFMSFNDSGEILISPRIPEEDLIKLNILEQCKKTAGSFRPEHGNYLEYHRKEVFLS